ncbi:MAG TPA: hypothetical protein VKB29_06265 [Candidatus Binataceae bacterium]|nr:hypothetical protein [Candidatus Binataceae bacterium]
MHRRDAIDSLLTACGVLALGALLSLALPRLVHFKHGVGDFRHRWMGHVEGIGGPLDVNGPLRVRGNLYIGGPATVHGQVQARSITVGGPREASLPTGEQPGPRGQSYRNTLAVGGPLTVQGPLIVDGWLVVGGPLYTEPAQ